MTVTPYTRYVRNLKATIDQVREKPSMFDDATIKLAICRNGFAYKSTDRLQRRSLLTEYWIGPVHSEVWRKDDGSASREEIEQFFQLPEIYAYSDLVLTFDRSPLMNAHWDATIGLVDVHAASAGRPAMKQRMLFIGFTDPVHAEFALSVDDALLVHDHRTGSQFFEWTEGDPEPHIGEATASCQTPLTAQPQQRWSRPRFKWWGTGLDRKQKRDSA